MVNGELKGGGDGFPPPSFPVASDGYGFERGLRLLTVNNSGGDTGNDSYSWTSNTLDGTNNVNDRMELKSSPDAIDIINAYTTVIVVQKNRRLMIDPIQVPILLKQEYVDILLNYNVVLQQKLFQ